MWYSQILRAAVNASKRGPISFDSYNETIYVGGKFSPAVDRLVREVGAPEAWEILVESGAAYGVYSDFNVKHYYA